MATPAMLKTIGAIFVSHVCMSGDGMSSSSSSKRSSSTRSSVFLSTCHALMTRSPGGRCLLGSYSISASYLAVNTRTFAPSALSFCWFTVKITSFDHVPLARSGLSCGSGSRGDVTSCERFPIA